MVERDRRDFGKAQAPGGEQPPVARDDAALAVDQDRHIEAERLDAVGDPPHLALRMQARVARVGLERLDRQPAHRDPRGLFRVRLALEVCVHEHSFLSRMMSDVGEVGKVLFYVCSTRLMEGGREGLNSLLWR